MTRHHDVKNVSDLSTFSYDFPTLQLGRTKKFHHPVEMLNWV